MGVSFAGVYTGIDTNVLVAQLMAVESRPLVLLQQRRSTWTTKQSALEEIRSRFADLQSHADTIRSISDLRNVLASSSDSDIVTATSSGGAAEGSHQVVINRLASAEKEIHDGVNPTETWAHVRAVAGAADEYLSAEQISDNTGSNYKFVFQFGSESQVSVDLSAYDATGISLNDLVAEINTAAGYTAATAAEVGGEYKLQIQAQNPGGDRLLAITDDAAVDLLDATEDFTQTIDGDLGTDYIVGAGQFVYTCNGVTRTITTTAGTTLGALQDLINNDSANPGVTASVLEYEVDADHKYHLVLSGDETGSDHTIVVEAATTLSGFAPVSFTETMVAQDAQVRVDGYPPSDWIERSSNSIANVIDGVTLELKAVGTATVGLSRDTTQLREDLQNLVNIYNGIVLVVDEYTGYDDEGEFGGVLQGDSGIASMVSWIRSILTSTAPGFVDTADAYTLAGQVGIEIDRYGELSLDGSTLSDALEADYQGVLDLLATSATGGSNSSYIQFTSAADSTAAGVYEVEVDFDGSGNITAARTRTKDETEWNDATFEDSVVTGMSGNDEQFLELTVTWDGSSTTQAAEVNVRQGLVGAIYGRLEDILDPTEGTITLKTGQYQDAIKQIDTNIELMEDRLVVKEQRLLAKFARMEAAMARFDAMQGAFQALFTQLAANNQAAQ